MALAYWPRYANGHATRTDLRLSQSQVPLILDYPNGSTTIT
ncbi:hypothetical protein [Moorena sp. SIOASIH]|nr:hypothetical protein [Moorena sp. SIOASIH]